MILQDSNGMTSLDVFEELFKSCAVMETELPETNMTPPLLFPLHYSPVTAVVTRSLCSVPVVSTRRLVSHATPQNVGAITRIDFLALLPPEIAVKILCYLRPRHLCRVVQVSRTWCWLAQYGPLRTQRLKYVQHKREKYLQSKENLYPGCRHLPTAINRTPHSFTQRSVGSAGSPLSSVQSNRSRPARARHSPTSNSRRDARTPPWTPRSLCHHQRYSVHDSQHTPENSDTYERMQGIEDDGFEVRRCLFPLANLVSKSNNLATNSDSDLRISQTELVLKNRASKRRLKRL